VKNEDKGSTYRTLIEHDGKKFQTSSPKMGGLGTKWGQRWCDVYPNELVFTFGGFYVCANFGDSPSRNASVRVHADGHMNTRTEANWFYNLFHAICYRYGTDKYSNTVDCISSILHTAKNGSREFYQND